MLGKRYYWLKLQEDFFSCPQIKKLRRIAGGDTFTIIYLKMQLLSIKSGGVIEYQGIESSFEEELSLILDEDLDNVKVTVAFLVSQGLIEQSDDRRFLLTQAAKNIGTECESAARMRAFRQSKALPASHCDENVQSCGKKVTLDIDKEKDKEREVYPPYPPTGGDAAALGKCAEFYQQNIGTLAPSTYQQIQEWMKTLPAEVILLAMQAAVDNGKRSWAYIRGILKRCADSGITSAAAWEAAESARNSGARASDGKRSPASKAREKLRQIAGGAIDEN